METENFNNWVQKEDLNKWHKVDKDNFIPPPTSTNVLFFTKGGGIFCGHYKENRKLFICYGIGKRELEDVEVTHWRILDFPIEFQQMLDNLDKETLMGVIGVAGTVVKREGNKITEFNLQSVSIVPKVKGSAGQFSKGSLGCDDDPEQRGFQPK